MNTIDDIIKIGKVSQYLVFTDIIKAGLYGGGINENLPNQINNVTNSVDWANNHPVKTSTANAIASITLSSTVNTFSNVFDSTFIGVAGLGGTINISVADPVRGLISLGSYTAVASDTTAAILAGHVAAKINQNKYGYIATVNSNTISITAAPGLGDSMNGGNNLIVTITNP
jgi:hypothetical protein